MNDEVQLRTIVNGLWMPVGVVAEGELIELEVDGPAPRRAPPGSTKGTNPWEHQWISLQARVNLPHPLYPQQRHPFDIYQIEFNERRIIFAAGELSANVWGFYVPTEIPDFAVFSE